MKWLITIVVVAGLAILVAAASGAFSAGAPVEIASVSRREIRQFVDEQAKTRLPQVHLITMPFDGRIDRIALIEGEKVNEGDVVARIVQKDLDDAVEEATAAVARLDASIRENKDKTVERTSVQQSLLFVESMDHTVAAAKNRTTSSRARLDYAEQNLARVKKVVDQGGSNKDEYERAQLAYVERQVDYEQDDLVWRASESIKSATALMPTMIRQYMDRKDLTVAVLEKQKAEAIAHLKQVETQRSRGQMTSPVSGIVLERLESNERRVAGGTVLLRIGALDELEVEADVLSQDVVTVRPGLAAEVYGPAVGGGVGQGVAATVHRVYPAGFTKISSLGVEQQRVRVILHFAPGVLAKLRRELEIGVDYRVRVRIFTAQKSDALVAPRSAVFRGAEGSWKAFAAVNGRARLTDLEVGLANDEMVEITSGLAPGEEVILAPESSLTDGARIHSLKPK